MINNRQQGGRRRGRGGGGGRIPSSAPSGNRQDNRQRGNAAQLLEKYKQLARDAQLGGDRVQSETYLQFAEHYFRVLNENRARFEEQRPRHRDDDYSDEDDGDEEMAADGEDAPQEEERFERPRREGRDRGDRNDNRERADYRDRSDNRERSDSRPERSDNRNEGRDRPERSDNRNDNRDNRERAESRDRQEARADLPRADAALPDGEGRNGEARFGVRPRRSRRDVNGGGNAGSEAEESRIALDILPPAISPAPPSADAGEADEEAPRPRRRTRRPRSDDAGEPAPAAA